MRSYLQSRWNQAGLALLIVGAGPLLLIIVAAALVLYGGAAFAPLAVETPE